MLKVKLLLFSFVLSLMAHAQCGTVISTFPYNENFETSAAWTSGGTNSDWAWGAPAHPTISSAGGGSKCWTVGGLTGSFYNYSEQSWIMSPCFDFSSLSYPWISFKIFWEDEWKYDGMVLQYSLNSGTTWTNVGAAGDAVNCLNDHWYNYNNITWLTSASPKHGWTGRTGPTSGSCMGGNGSNGWITAKHCMSALANQPNVRFRFLFGSGTTCNSYDGISIDDILIDNAPANVASYTYACAGPMTVNFTNTSIMCPTGYFWDFGDGSTSTMQNPSHTYATYGTYNVTLTASGPCNASGSITQTVSIIGVNTITTSVTCNGAANGIVTTTITGGGGPYMYTWTPGGATTSGLSGLSPGTYFVQVTTASGCPATASVNVTEPTVLSATTTTLPVSCNGGTNGSSTANVTGGTTPYSYFWTPVGEGTATVTSLSAGTYTVTITDANSCTTNATATIDQPTTLSLTATSTNTTCGKANGSASATVSGGITGYSYLWSPSGGSAANAFNLSAGTYTNTVTDANGCTANATVIIAPSAGINTNIISTPPLCYDQANASATGEITGGTLPYTFLWNSGQTTSSLTNITAGNYCMYATDANGCKDTTCVDIANPSQLIADFSSDPGITDLSNPEIHFTDLSPGATIWNWNFGDSTTASSENPVHTYGTEGSFPIVLIVSNANGCTDTVVHEVIINGGFTFFAPDAFTPDGDGLNDTFLPKGSDWDVSKFDLWIYDRWGNCVFHSKDVNTGWDGKTHSGSSVLSDVFVWKVNVAALTGQFHSYLGSVTLVK